MVSIEHLLRDPMLPRLELRLLMEKVTHWSWTRLITHADSVLSASQYAEFITLKQRRLSGEPIAYLLGQREFYGLNFHVSPAVLIPRPETEGLVDWALEWDSRPRSVLDLGTGSGAIALALKVHRPLWSITGADNSETALEVARRNAAHLTPPGISPVPFVHSHWFDAFKGKTYDLIVANPPYIAAEDFHVQQGDLRFEPASALTSGPQGMDALSHIIASASLHLSPSGSLLVEHGYDQAEACRQALDRAGFDSIVTRRDLAGQERLTGGKYSKK
ncbi:MAG: peptide chain release factor N(5)-glutamine methyltransferase [Ferrovum sp.]|nr:peptide chain release factor N(5)-glutamine methyltransferase [Ferrovum sp.]NDU87820.1 peptide chain release factor N(5)-glutamine methyltransferase [Ferrovum sp.]